MANRQMANRHSHAPASLRWWHLNHDPDTGAWAEVDDPVCLAFRQHDCETTDEVTYYDGFIWGADVQAASLELAIAKAQELERAELLQHC